MGLCDEARRARQLAQHTALRATLQHVGHIDRIVELDAGGMITYPAHRASDHLVRPQLYRNLLVLLHFVIDVELGAFSRHIAHKAELILPVHNNARPTLRTVT